MEILERINKTFGNVIIAIKAKKFSEVFHRVKSDLHSLGCDLIQLGKISHEHFIRSLAMEGYISLLTVKTLPLTLLEKKNTLRAAYEKLLPYQLRNECLFVFLRIQNLLCFYLIRLEQLLPAQEILKNTEELYCQINKSKPCMYLDAKDLFEAVHILDIKCMHPEKIDKVITNNIQMQAFIYNKLNMQDKYTLYNHTALRRQLEMKEGTPQDWALRTARLGNYFIYLSDMNSARHHLCAAYIVLHTCHENAKLIPNEFIRQKSEFEINFLELSHYWVKYGLNIFKMSKKKILNKYFGPTTPVDWPKSVDLTDEIDEKVGGDENLKDLGSEKVGEGDTCNEKTLFTFPTLDLNDLETRVPIKLISTIAEAKVLFGFTHKWLMRAKNYYDMEHYPSQYVSCCLQLAELYEHLAFFERNVDHQYSLQKRRADVLESLNTLLKTCDDMTSVQIDVIRELSQVQLELMALNLQKLWREESQANIFDPEHDNEDSIFNSMTAVSNNTLTEKTLFTSSKNKFLKKMDAATSLNGRLLRLSGQLNFSTPPSQLSFHSYRSMFN